MGYTVLGRRKGPTLSKLQIKESLRVQLERFFRDRNYVVSSTTKGNVEVKDIRGTVLLFQTEFDWSRPHPISLNPVPTKTIVSIYGRENIELAEEIADVIEISEAILERE